MWRKSQNTPFRHLWDSGFSVFPLLPDGKTPLPGMSWRRYQDKRATLREIEWWDSQRDSMGTNIAVVTGEISGVVVLDTDSVEGTLWALDQGIPDTVTAKTRKGFHFYFLWESSWSCRNKVRFASGCDIRGDGGYVVAPPSSIYEFNYGWVASPWMLTPQGAPEWMRSIDSSDVLSAVQARQPVVDFDVEPASSQRIQPVASLSQTLQTEPFFVRSPDKYFDAILRRECESVANCTNGSRNVVLNRAAFCLGQVISAASWSDEHVESSLLRAAESSGLAGDDGYEAVNKTIRSGIRSGKSRPRAAVG